MKREDKPGRKAGLSLEKGTMRFNEQQREGLAKVFDNLATAHAVSGVVALVIDQKIDRQPAGLWGAVAVM